MIAVHETLLRLLAEGRRVAVATVIRGRGSRPRQAGAKMLVADDGRTFFTVGGGALEASVVADCRAALAGHGSGVHRYDLAESGPHAVGMTCGGSVEVFVDVEEPPARLVVFGAGHVGRALAQAASVAGFTLTLVDDRAEWLRPEDLPPGSTLHRCAPDYARDLPEVPAEALAAVMTRCHATDVNVLEHLASARPRYVGLIGSRRKILRAFRTLEQRGVDRSWLDAIHAPIGLDVGAETPGEIAIAVAAELVAVVRGRTGAEAARSLAAAVRRTAP